VEFSLLLLLISMGCADKTTNGHNEEKLGTFFHLMDSTETGVGFVNEVYDQNEFNILTYRNYYNGGGVAIGDINNDGIADLFFTANMDKNRLYVGEGDLKYKDITDASGIAGTKGWSTGVTMADIDGDGWLDIYVSNSGDLDGDNKQNELFINNHDLTFSEQAEKYGLNNQGYSTQAAFFDYDLDGDLDCYLLNNSFKDPSKIELFRSMRDIPDELGGDKLFRNDGHVFTDVTLDAGIYSSAIGFGLGACISDLNQDQYPDIYVSNDFWERDYLYINNGDGTFSEELIDRIDFCSISSMGGDIGDINNDGFPEIISTDMLAADNYRLKAMSAFDPYHLEDIKYRANYHYQVAQNCLHLNDGDGNFKEVANMANVAATDWSWGALLFDFENDGRKDLFVSNGLQRDLMYMDFRDFLSDNQVHVKMSKGEEINYEELIAKMPSNPLKNYAFSNKNGIEFVNVADSIGLSQATFSNGAAYGDLDNDGDLDLVISNVNAPAFIYRNEAESSANSFLKIKFKGADRNRFGIGAVAKITTSDGIQTMQNFNTRGFESCVMPELIFGLGKSHIVNELEITWPNGMRQILSDVEGNQTLIIDQVDADLLSGVDKPQVLDPMLLDVSGEKIIGESTHHENRYNGFDHEGLLIRMLSTEGPRIVQGDMNGDGVEDFISLGARDDEDKLFLQEKDRTFRRASGGDIAATSPFESTCGVLFDFDRDGDLDLLLGAGGNEYQRGAEFFILRFFRNDGQGAFTFDDQNLPQIVGNFSCIEADDFDQDGDIDLFIGARNIPGNYGLTPRNFLLINDQGTWTDRTPSSLAGVGMVTDAVWSDVDGDDDHDLVVVGDWMGVQIFENKAGQITFKEELPASKGWWTRIEASDLDRDGDPDFVLGNWGLNSKFKASTEKPLTMYVNDFDQNGKSEFIINWYAPNDNRAYPFPTKMDLVKQLPGLRKQALKYEDYAGQTYNALFDAELRGAAIKYKAETLSTSVMWNNAGRLQLQTLPLEAQESPIFGIAVDDFDGDDRSDIWLGGNFYAMKPQAGRHDASRGLVLKGVGNQSFKALTSRESGVYVRGEVRDAAVIKNGNSRNLLIARNNAPMVIFDYGKIPQ